MDIRLSQYLSKNHGFSLPLTLAVSTPKCLNRFRSRIALIRMQGTGSYFKAESRSHI